MYVDVDVRFDVEGEMRLYRLVWQDCRTYETHRALDVRPGFSEKACAQGNKYCVRVKWHERVLFFKYNVDGGAPVAGR